MNIQREIDLNTKKRIAYYDVAKGVLICLVIISHIYLETLSVAKIHNSTFAWMRSWQWIHVSFFMPAFFFISGLCSNFNKDFKPFLINIVRTILVPAIIFDLMFFTIPNILMGQVLPSIVITGFIKRALAFGGVFWFLPCLFLSKLIYWVLNKYTSYKLRWLVLIALLVFGFVLHHYKLFPQKWWYVQHVCDLTLFLGVGQFLKNTTINKEIVYIISFGVFLIIIALFLIKRWPIPYITYKYNIGEWWHLPVHPLISIVGTMTVLWICQAINSNSLLEYLGQGTIVVYGVHQLFLKIVIRYLEPLLEMQGPSLSVLMFITLFVSTIAFSALAIWVFNKKYINSIIGK